MRPKAFQGRGGEVKAALVEAHQSGTSVAVARARFGLGVEAAGPRPDEALPVRVRRPPLAGLHGSIS